MSTVSSALLDAIDELGLLNVRMMALNKLEQTARVFASGRLHVPLEVVVAPCRHVLGVIENLGHDLAASFRILPELTLDERHVAAVIDEEIVAVA
jgi:hypothetical protein